jgi:hypothetical protein
MNFKNREDLMKKPLRWSEKDLNQTPSIQEGISIEDERIERYIACQIVRDLIRDVFKTKENTTSSMPVQILGCYYLQLFFMFQSMKNFDARHAVAFAAARLACKVYDEKPRGGGMYLELDRLRGKNGLEGLSEKGKQEIRQQASEIEIFLLRITNFHFDISLPCDDIDVLVEKVLVKLSRSESYKKLIGDKNPETEVNHLKDQIVTSSRQFLTDAFMGLTPLRFSRRCNSLSAILFAVRYTVRKMEMKEIINIVMVLDGEDDEPDSSELEAAFTAILNVFKIKGSAEKKVKEPPPWANVHLSGASATTTTPTSAPLATAATTTTPATAPAKAPVAEDGRVDADQARKLRNESQRQLGQSQEASAQSGAPAETKAAPGEAQSQASSKNTSRDRSRSR